MPVYAIDTETTGFNYYLGDTAFSVQWCGDDKPAEYLEFSDNLIQLCVALGNRDNEWVGHNILFDLTFLQAYNMVPAGPWHDTMVMAHVHNPAEPSKALKALAKKYLNRENLEEKKIEDWFAANGMRGKDSRKYNLVPRELMEPYARADVEMTMGLYKFYKKLGVLENPVYKLEMQVLPVLMDIKRRGMKIDKEFASREAIRTAEMVKEYGLRAKNEWNIDNLGSDLELAQLLFTTAGLECQVRTPKGAPCLDEAALKLYNHPVVQLVQDYRDATKMNSTYLDPMLNKTDKEDIIHGNLNQCGARTGRLSSSEPNLQNIPRSGGLVDVRRGFICKPECRLLFVDFSQIELRVLAHYCREQSMVDVLSTRDGDLHAATATAIFGDRYPSLSAKALRTVAKTINFATIYGAGARQLYDTLAKALPDAGITLEQAKEFRSAYLAGYPQLRSFIWDVERRVRETGYVFDIFGRKYPCESDKAYRAVNYLIQGCAAGIAKTAMVKVHAFLKGKKSGLINVVHDEYIIDLHESELHLIKELVEIIEDFHQFRVPIYANAAISSTNWAEKKDLDLTGMGTL